MIKSAGGEASFVTCDVTKAVDVEAMVARAVELYGGLDYAFNNAGIGPDGNRFPVVPVAECPEEIWDRTLDINLKGVFLCCQTVGKGMIEQGGGKIINISSAAAVNGEQGFLAYCVSKSGVMMLTRVLAYEWSKHNITVNAIAPGFVAAGMNTPILNKEMLVSGLSNRVPLKRLGQPEEIVKVALFLASEDSAYINGTTIVADGGMAGYSPTGFIDLIAEMKKKASK